MMYALAEKDIDGDAYDIGLGDKHRDIVKQCFNAMVQSEQVLLRNPRTIKLKGTGFSWGILVKAILKRHSKIKDMFFRGLGNTLQFEDSQIAEQILLHFSKKNIPILPVHDSFLARHGDTEELFGLMDELFKKRFNRKCKIKMEKKFIPVEFTKMDSVENIIKVNEEHSMWNKRHGY